MAAGFYETGVMVDSFGCPIAEKVFD